MENFNPYNAYNAYNPYSIYNSKNYHPKLGDRLYLPIIKNKINEIKNEKERVLQDTHQIIQDRISRNQILNNYNYLYNNRLYGNNNEFYYMHPPNMPYYRPIKYFYQRPVKLTPDNAFVEQRPHIKQTIINNHKVTEVNSKAKWGKPLRMDDLIKPADEVHKPLAHLISSEEVKKRQEEVDALQKKIEHIDPENKRKAKQNNKKYWKFIDKFKLILKFFRAAKEFSHYSKTLKKNKDYISQANRADFSDLTQFIVTKLKNIEEFAVDNFSEIFVFDKTLQNKTEDTVFVIKNFVHQIFYELSAGLSLKGDLPANIKKILLTYISDGKYLPDNYLTTFEFNRLEFDISLALTNLKIDQQSMILGFMILYRILIIEVFSNYEKYFPDLVRLGKNKMRKVDASTSKSNNPNNLNNRPNNKNFGTETLISENIKYNMNFIIGILDCIVKQAFSNSPKIYRENFKDTHLFKRFVIDGSTFTSIPSIEEKLKKDGVEFSERITKLPKVEEFIQENIRWFNMYKMSAFSFCMNLVDIIKS